MILVDATVLIDFFAGQETPAAARLRTLEEMEVPFAVPLVCFQEVIQGARDERDFSRLVAVLSSQVLVAPEDPEATHLAAARISFECRRKGMALRGGVDAFIAALALERGDVLLHDDEDFEKIKKVRPLETLRS